MVVRSQGLHRAVKLLWQHQQLSSEDLAAKLQLNQITLTKIIKSLENANLVTCAHSNQNDRDIVVSLTPIGTEFQHKTSQIQQKMACETGLTPLDQVELREKLDKLLDNL